MVAVGASAAASADARVGRIALLPAGHHGAFVRAEDPVVTADIAFPAGRVGSLGPLGVAWEGHRPHGAPSGCLPTAGTFGIAGSEPVPAYRIGLVGIHRSVASVLVIGAGRPAPVRVRGERVVGHTRTARELAAYVHFRLPAGVLPSYPRREIYIAAFEGGLGDRPDDCPPVVRRRGEAGARAALRGPRVVLPPSYSPPPPAQPPPTRDLAAGGGLELQGVRRGDVAGVDVAAAGDVNGDGRPDALVSSPYANGGAGATYLVFGRSATGIVQLARLEPGGFRIDGPGARAGASHAVGVGDMDGDGLSDIAVGAPGANGYRGAVYIVRGKRDATPVSLARRDDVLFTIYGSPRCAAGGGVGIGDAVAPAGDANGDGIPDIAVLAAGCGDAGHQGGIYIVFGKRSAGDVDLRRLGSAGIAVRTRSDDELDHVQLAGLGDVNGDGLADVVAGDLGYDTSSYAAVVLGRRTGASLAAARLPLRITSELCAGIGDAVAGPGDVNGDGLADVVVGAPESCAAPTGRAFVIFGRPGAARVDVDELGAGGYVIAGTPSFTPGRALGAAGDVNGDGLADIALGDEQYNAGGRETGGAVVVVFGQRSTDLVRIASLGAGGVRWLGAAAGDSLGGSVAGVGDFNGDGRPDILAGAPHAHSQRGAAWLLP